jgi:hypothetical protein
MYFFFVRDLGTYMNKLYQHLTVIHRIMSWAAGYQIFIAEDRANYQCCQCKICCWQSGSGTGILQSTKVYILRCATSDLLSFLHSEGWLSSLLEAWDPQRQNLSPTTYCENKGRRQATGYRELVSFRTLGSCPKIHLMTYGIYTTI